MRETDSVRLTNLLDKGRIVVFDKSFDDSRLPASASLHANQRYVFINDD